MDRNNRKLYFAILALLSQFAAFANSLHKNHVIRCHLIEEIFLHNIFENMSNVESIQNGFGWRTDHGADLIVKFQNPVIGVNTTSTLIIQAKSYEGNHYDLNAVDQLIEGIKEYNADGGLLITTAQKTEELEDRIRKAREEIDKEIDLMAGNDVARFVFRYAPEILLGIN